MDAALVTLLKLRARGMVRHTFRGVKTVRGALFFIVGLALLVVWLGPSLFMAVAVEHRSNPETVRTFFPLVMALMCLTAVIGSGRQRGIYFSPAEIDFLFSGPFSRRQLLTYKLSTTAAGAAFGALVLSAVLLRHATWWIAAFAGSLLAMLAVQLVSTAVTLIGLTVAERAFTRARKLLLLVAAAAAVFVLSRAFVGGIEGGFVDRVVQFRQSWIGLCLLVPFEPFGRTFAAETLSAVVGWTALAVAVDLALLGLVMRLDVNYLETAVDVSRKFYHRVQRARRGGAAWASTGSAKRRLPLLPWLGGAGPVAWKQLTAAIRGARGMLFLLVILGFAMAPTLVGIIKSDKFQVGLVIGPMVVLTVIFSRLLPFDFRGDLDHIDWLKSLPLTPAAVAVGQIVVPTLILTAFHLVMLALVVAFAERPPAVLAAVGLFALPFNFLLIAVENFLFLLFPVRLIASTPGDFQHIGRTMVEMLVKMLVLGACGGLAASSGMLAYWALGRSQTAGFAVAWLVLATTSVAAVPCVGWAYRRFDVSRDTPA